MMAEFLGKVTGVCKGKGGCMHIAEFAAGILGANGIVGGGIPIAVGAALGTALQNIDRIVVCFFGDGASNEGTFHEALNLASVWKLPVLFACINNQYGMSMHVRKSMNIPDIAARASSYGMPGQSIDGNDAVAVFEATREARTGVAGGRPYSRPEHLPHHGPLEERRGAVPLQSGSGVLEEEGPLAAPRRIPKGERDVHRRGNSRKWMHTAYPS